MSEQIYALINPELLLWAREMAGYSREDVIHKLKIKSEKLDEWEKGISHPTMKQLRKLGDLYKRPISIFYLPEKPKDFQTLQDFRKLPGTMPFLESPQLKFEIRKAISRREVALDLMADIDEEAPELNYKITINDDSEEAGIKMRELLNINKKEQMKWAKGYESLNKWRSAVENLGILVFQVSGVDIEEMRGFSIAEFPLPVIGLNSKETPNGRIFTLLHELVHILLKQGGLCDLYDDKNIEVFCNKVAGSVLIPGEDLSTEDIVKNKVDKKDWSDDELKELSHKFKVSKEVVLRRLLTIGFITEEFYRIKREELLREYKKLRDTEQGGFALPHQKVISNAGLNFVRLVLSSYHQEKITSSDLADYLDVRLKHLPKIISEVNAKSLRTGVLI